MCGRYVLDEHLEKLSERFQTQNQLADTRPNYNVAPRQSMPIIRQDTMGNRSMLLATWGMPRTIGPNKIKEIINTRSDKAFGPFWNKTVCSRRCLVPANGFYEWQKTSNAKLPYYIHPKDESLYAFAGIWDTWKDTNGNAITVYSIMTSEPNKEMRSIHDRMPVMLRRDQEAAWLDSEHSDAHTLESLLLPSEDGRLEIYQISNLVNNPRYNSPDIVRPI